MTITLQEQYKSLSPFSAENLPNFCTIIGKNGSGKTQLLELINLYRSDQFQNFTLDIERGKIQIEGIDLPSSSNLDAGLYGSAVTQLWSEYSSIRQLLEVVKIILEGPPNISFLNIEESLLTEIIKRKAAKEVRYAIDPLSETAFNPMPIDLIAAEAANRIIKHAKVLEVSRLISMESKIPIDKLLMRDFNRFQIDEKFLCKLPL